MKRFRTSKAMMDGDAPQASCSDCLSRHRVDEAVVVALDIRETSMNQATSYTVLGAMLAFISVASYADTESFPPDQSKIEFHWGVKIPLRDGIRLNATLYTPKDQQAPAPCIFTLNPYNAEMSHAQAVYFAAHGLVFANVDSRGKGNSAGSFRAYIQEAKDGYDVVEWLAKQPYCNGKVAMWGASYEGYDQWATAKERPPHLATIVPTEAPYLGDNFPMRNNIFPLYVMRWITLGGSGVHAAFNIFGDTSFWRAKNREWIESGRSFTEFDAIVGNRSATFQEWIAHPQQDAYWAAYNPTAEQYAKLSIPILTIIGEYGSCQMGGLRFYREYMQNTSAEGRSRAYLIIGPWDHGGSAGPRKEMGGVTWGPASLLDMNKLHRDWFAWTMQGGSKPEFLRKNVAYYVGGAEKWRYADTLEGITERAQPYYLDSSSNPTDVLKSSGSLRSEPPSQSVPDHYVYDPRDFGDANLAMTLDSSKLTSQRLVYAARGKVLVYHSEPFVQDTEVSGTFKLSVWLAIDQPDTDFEAAVYAIDADGNSILLTTDVMRARYRESVRTEKVIRTGEALRYDFERFTLVSRLMKKGSRLRLVVGPVSEVYPIYPDVNDSVYTEKNFNSGGVVAAESMKDARPVTVRLYHDSSHPSALYVPMGHAEAPDEPTAPVASYSSTPNQ